MIRLDRVPSAQYNQLTMPELKEELEITEDSVKKKPQFQSSRIGSTAVVKGEWVCNEDMLIEGKFQGKLNAKDHDLHIEKEATVKADLQGRNILIMGKVTGNVTASGKILIGADAKMTGDLSAPQISIQDGARFKGTVKMFHRTI